MTIRAITFDFWQTLFQEDGHHPDRMLRRIRAFSEATGVSEEEATKAHTAATDEFFRTHIEEQRNLGPRDGVRLMCAACGAEVDGDTAEELAEVFGTAILEHPPVPIDGALEAVQAAAAEYPIALVCDSGMSPGSSLRVLLERHGFTPYFRALTFSDEVGVSKPQAAMFETAAKAVGVTPEETMHIGDLEPTDIAGALGVGATAALFAGANPKYLATTKAHHTFTHWHEFLRLLPEL